MANRYWVGGTATWDATAGSKWALTSGGAGGQAVPTSSDDVFFDANSGAVTITISGNTGGNAELKSLTCTGFTGTVTVSDIMNVYGNFTLVAGMTWSSSAGINFGASGTLTTAGKTLTSGSLTISADSVTLTLGDDLSTTGSFSTGNASITFNANDKNLSLVSFTAVGATSTISMGTGTWTILGNGGNLTVWSIASDMTINPSTSTIKIVDTSSSAIVTFAGAGKTYNNIWWARGTSTSQCRITGSNTFNNIRDTGTATHDLRFTAGTTQTFTSWSVSGNPGALISLQTVSGTSTYTFSCASGIISADYLNIQHCIAGGGATYYAGANSVDNQAVATAGSGWIFTAPPATVNSNFFAFF